MSNKDIAAKFSVPKSTILTWFKNKDEILSLLEEGQNVKSQKLRDASHESLDHGVFKWFLNIRGQKVP